MGILEDLFGTSKPKVSKEEFREACNFLSVKGFDEREINEVKKIFRADLEESSEYERGIDQKEIEQAMKWMREHTSSHCLSTSKIQILEEILKKKL